MAAFNDWVKGSAIDALPERKAATVALNLLYLSAVLHRVRQLQIQGLRNPEWESLIRPLPEATVRAYLNNGRHG
jgi:hypothetical protein